MPQAAVQYLQPVPDFSRFNFNILNHFKDFEIRFLVSVFAAVADLSDVSGDPFMIGFGVILAVIVIIKHIST